MKYLLFFLFVAPLSAVPADTELTLVSEPGFNELLLTVAPDGFSASSDTTVLSGSFAAALEVEPSDGKVSELTITGGPISGSDTSFSGGGFFGSYSLTLAGFGARILTPDPPGLVDPATGDFDGAQFAVSADQGTISGSVNSLLGNQPVNLSLADEPLTGPGSSTGNVTLMLQSEDAISKTYQATLIFPVNIQRIIPVDPINVTVTATGTVKATGPLVVGKSDYLAWTISQNIPGADPAADGNFDGVPNAIAFALGLGAGENASPFVPQAASVGFTLELPAAGTAAPILIECSTTLGGWSDLPAERLPTTANPIPAGTSGIVTIVPSGDGAEFIRLNVSE